MCSESAMEMRYEDDINTARRMEIIYAVRRCSMITRLTRDSLTRVRVRWGAAIFAFYTCINNWQERILRFALALEQQTTPFVFHRNSLEERKYLSKIMPLPCLQFAILLG